MKQSSIFGGVAIALALAFTTPATAQAQDLGLVTELAGLGVTTSQASGGLMAIMQLAQTNLGPADFGKLMGMLPEMNDFMGAAGGAAAGAGATGRSAEAAAGRAAEAAAGRSGAAAATGTGRGVAAAGRAAAALRWRSISRSRTRRVRCTSSSSAWGSPLTEASQPAKRPRSSTRPAKPRASGAGRAPSALGDQRSSDMLIWEPKPAPRRRA